MRRHLARNILLCSLVVFSLPAIPSMAEEVSKEQEMLFVAKKAMDDGFYDVSLGILERFQKNYPSSKSIPESNLLVGQCYYHQSRYLDALAKFEELQRSPDAKNIRDAVWYWIAEVHFKGNNYAKAAEFYRKIVESAPASQYKASANFSLGWCLLQDQKYQDALAAFKSVEENYPKDPLAHDSAFKIVECLYNLKEYAQLQERLKGYLRKFSQDPAKLPFLTYYMAESYYYLNNLPEAVTWYAKVPALTRDERMIALSRLGAGWSYLKLKKYKESQDAFSGVKEEQLEKQSREVFFLGKGALAIETKDYTRAVSVYDALTTLATDPDVLLQAYLGKADALYNMAEYLQAIAVYKKGLEKEGEGAAADTIDKLHYGLAWSYLKQGEFKNAIEEFKKIAKLSQDKVVKVAALCQIGDTYQDSGDYQRAIQTYDTILKDYPDSYYSDYVQYQLGLSLMKASKFDAAILAFQAVKTRFPSSTLIDDATYALGLAYFQRENYTASREVFEQFQKEFKDSTLSPQATYLLGTSYFNLGKYAEAIEVFKDVIRLYGQESELVQKAEYEIADCYYQMGNEKEAMSRFKALRTKYPDSSLTAEVMWWLGEYYYRHKDLVMARRYFASLPQDFPGSRLVPDALYALGSVDEEEGKHQDAIDKFKKVIESGKSDLSGTAAIAIADIYMKLEQFDLALATFNDALKQNPNLAGIIYPKMGDIYRSLNKYDEALDWYRKALGVVPVREMGPVQFRIAETLESKGGTDASIEEYLKVPYLYDDTKELTVKSYLRVAKMYEEKGKDEEAASLYRKIIGLGVQESKYARERLDSIQPGRRQ